MKKKTAAQKFADIFARFVNGSTPEERSNAEGHMDAWLKRHGKNRNDIGALLAEAHADDAGEAKGPTHRHTAPDPRDAQPNVFEDDAFTAVGLVHGITGKYLVMPEHVAVVYSLWICQTHVYERFEVVPRLKFTSEDPDSGKTTGLKVARQLVRRPNEESLGTGAAITHFLDGGLGTVLLDELDYADADARKRLLKIWNLGHTRGTTISIVDRGQRRLFPIFAPMLGAGLGNFLGATQLSRAFVCGMRPFTDENKPERRFDSNDVGDLNAVYIYLRNWAQRVTLDPDPPMPDGMLRRHADNARGLLSIADSCGPEWGRRARRAILTFLDIEQKSRPHILILAHGLAIFEALGLEQISTTHFNAELKQLALPDAIWRCYSGPSGMEVPHPITPQEQARLLQRSKISSRTGWPSARKSGASKGSFKCYRRADFEAAYAEQGRPIKIPHLVMSKRTHG